MAVDPANNRFEDAEIPQSYHRFRGMADRGDWIALRHWLNEEPEILHHPKWMGQILHDAAMHQHSPTLVALLYEMGVDLNIAQLESPMTRPVSVAANIERWDTLRWLVEHGAEINYEVGGREPYCVPLGTIIRSGRLDMVKLLVEAGAILDVCDRRNLTPLGWAIQYGQTEIADYLRSKGAIEPQHARNYRPPLPKTPVMQYMESRFGPIKSQGWQQIIPSATPIAVHTVWHEDYSGAFTDGMSAKAMNVPQGMERYRFAELAMPLGEYWPDDPQVWGEDQYVWAIQWLHRLADYPFEANTWLGRPHCIIANNDPPEPLSDYTEMTCWLLLVDKDPLNGFTRADGSEVVFYTLFPIHTAEREFERQHGLRALLEKFSEKEVSTYIDPHRESVV